MEKASPPASGAMDQAAMLGKAEQAAALLANLANAKRLLVLCHLAEGERSVGALTALVGQSQSALSQHLARLRDGGLVATRRDGTTIYYRLATEDVRQLIDILCDRFGPPAQAHPQAHPLP